MQSLKKPLSALKRLINKRPQVLINVKAPAGSNVDSNPQVAAKVSEVESRLAGRGRVLLRSSGTEPVIRVMVEGDDAAQVQQAAEEIASVVKATVNAAAQLS